MADCLSNVIILSKCNWNSGCTLADKAAATLLIHYDPAREPQRQFTTELQISTCLTKYTIKLNQLSYTRPRPTSNLNWRAKETGSIWQVGYIWKARGRVPPTNWGREGKKACLFGGVSPGLRWVSRSHAAVASAGPSLSLWRFNLTTSLQIPTKPDPVIWAQRD